LPASLDSNLGDVAALSIVMDSFMTRDEAMHMQIVDENNVTYL
jgi:hypothetical protein